jgi:NAD(P)-dependent dehydrogenase (short-subunit alcohol dehydrogenase family)
MTTLSGKVALVTGGTSGIGKAAAMSPTSRFASTHWLRLEQKSLLQVVAKLKVKKRFSKFKRSVEMAFLSRQMFLKKPMCKL